MVWTVQDLARLIEGEVEGDGTRNIDSIAAIEEADGRAISPLLRKDALQSAPCLPGAVLTSDSLAPFAREAGLLSLIKHPQPVRGMAKLIDIFFPPDKQRGGVHPSAVVHPEASVDQTAWIGPLAVVEKDVVIGPGSRIESRAVVCQGTRIGAHVTLGPGAVIGAEGFGFVPTIEGPQSIRHVGRVVIEDNVTIGANTCVDRATLGTTRIGSGTKIDNLVQLGHNVQLGSGCLIAAQTGLAGSTRLGDDVMLGGQVGVADHLRLGNGAKVAGKSGVTGHVAQNQIVAGYPALPHRKWLRAMAWVARESCRSSAREDDRAPVRENDRASAREDGRAHHRDSEEK